MKLFKGQRHSWTLAKVIQSSNLNLSISKTNWVVWNLNVCENLWVQWNKKIVQMICVTWQRWPSNSHIEKKLKHLPLQNQLTNGPEIWYVHSALDYYRNYTNGDLWFSLTFCMTKSNVDMGKCWNIWLHGNFWRFWLRNWYRLLSKLVHEDFLYKRSRSFFDL